MAGIYNVPTEVPADNAKHDIIIRETSTIWSCRSVTACWYLKCIHKYSFARVTMIHSMIKHCTRYFEFKIF